MKNLKPIAFDPIEALCGILKGGPSLADELLDERRKDNKIEGKDLNRRIKRRIKEIKSGKAKGRPAKKIFAEIRRRYT